MSIFTLSFLFSIKGLVYTCIIALLIGLLQGYPEWKNGHLKEVKTEMEEKENEKKKEMSNEESDNNEKLSLMHYILVSPFAALYILGRGCVDMIRYSLYYTIWYCEKSIPYVDDWLFEFVTVSIPEKYEKTETWWINQGKPSLIRFREYVRHSIVPNVVEYTEYAFVSTYKLGCAVQSMVIEIIGAWKRFIEKHDWEQLAQDLGDIAYARLWIPATKVFRLFQLAYIGTRASLISLVSDIQWICTVVIPKILSSRIAQTSYRGIIYLGDQMKKIFWYIYAYLLTPTIGRILTWIIRTIDRIIDEHTIPKKLARIYSILAPQLVWLVIEFSSFINLVKSGSLYLYTEVIYPAYQLFKKEVLPHLTRVYEDIRDFMSPLYPYLNRMMYLCYIYVIVPVYRQFQQHIKIPPAIFWVVISRLKDTMGFSWNLFYGFIQNWLIRQAPVLSKMIQNSYEYMIHSRDWRKFYTEELFSTFYELYVWLSHQLNLLYLSFERTLTTWVEQQQQEKEVSRAFLQ